MTGALPRLDWLLLLHDERPEHFRRCLVLGGDAALAKALEVIGGAESVERSLDRRGAYDLVVVIRPESAEQLARAMSRLLPGGVGYVESHRFRGLSGTRVEAVLRAAKLDECGQWALLPNAKEPHRYLPLDAPRAWRWYLRTLFMATSPTLRLLSRALAVAPRSRRLLRFAAPGVATLVMRPDSGLGQDRGSALADAAVKGSKAWDWRHTVLITSGYDSGSRAVVLPFRRGAKWPEEVVKVARRQEMRDATRREHQRLVQLREDLPPSLVRMLPYPRGVTETERSTAARQSPARGRLMLTDAGKWPRRRELAERDLREVAAWLAGLHRATAKPPAEQQPGERWLRRPLAWLRTLIDVTAPVVALVEIAAQALDDAGPLPVVAQHYDVGPWNIVRGRESFTLLDWEVDPQTGRNGWGPPAVDLIYFATAWYNLSTSRLDRNQELEGLVEAFDRGGSGWQGAALRREVVAFAYAVNLSLQAIRPLVVACWLERAVTARSRWDRLRDGEPDQKGLEFLGVLAANDFTFKGAGGSRPW